MAQSLLEEGQEVIGVLRSRSKKMFKDVVVEAAIGAAGEGVFGTIGSLFGRVVKGSLELI